MGEAVQAEQKKEAVKAGRDLIQLEAKYEATSLQDEYVVFKYAGEDVSECKLN